METQITTSQYELLKIILDFIGSIIWPITVFIIIIIYHGAILKLINRAKKVELPGGISVETVEENIEYAKVLAEEIKTERKPQIQKFIDKAATKIDSEANKRMVQLGLTPSPSGLHMNYYKQVADIDPRLALAGLRLDLELMLKNLAKGFKITIGEKEPATQIISKLLNAGKITTRQYEFLNTIFKISSSATHGIPFTKEQAYEVLDIGQVLVEDYIAWLDWGFSK